MGNIPQVKVGIMSEPKLEFELNGDYRVANTVYCGTQSAECSDGKVLWNGQLHDEVLFEPINYTTGSFTLIGVTIGVNFHWERKENQSFSGSLKIIVENGKLTAVNILSVEDYLLSVISSEMSATASLELLKAHAVISRSWLLSQIEKRKKIDDSNETYSAIEESEGEVIRWWDREDHVNFDVCADDHCQRYQGITRASTETVRQAIEATFGKVLTYDGELCDARFSKCCGGVYEEIVGSQSIIPISWQSVTTKMRIISPTLPRKPMLRNGYSPSPRHFAIPPMPTYSRRCSITTIKRPTTFIAGAWNTPKKS